jgi:hypothetical protein
MKGKEQASKAKNTTNHWIKPANETSPKNNLAMPVAEMDSTSSHLGDKLSCREVAFKERLLAATIST